MHVWARKGLWAVVAVAVALTAAPGCTDTTSSSQDTGTEPVDTATGTDATTGDASDASSTDAATGDAAGGDSGGKDLADADDAKADLSDGTDLDQTAPDGSDGSGTTDATNPDAASPDALDGSSSDAGDAGAPIEKGIYPATCAADTDCKNPCVVGGTCKDSKCTFTPKAGACLVDLGDGKIECIGEGDTSAQKPCLVCAKTGKSAQLSSSSWTAPLDKAGEGVVIAEVYKAGVTWNYSPKRSTSGGASLYFGDPAKATYNVNKQVGATATLPPAKVPTSAELTPEVVFWLWLETEQSAGDDLLSVAVLEGTTTTKLWNSDAIGGSTHGSWQRISVPLKGLAGKTVQVILSFETKDGTLNAFEGAYVDDVAISSGCCASESDCNDGNLCTADACKAEAGKLPQCSHTAKADCCASSADCDDGKPCTLDLCPSAGGACTHSDKPGCCMSVGDCDDKDACTEDACPAPGGLCTHANQCCKSDGECSTADPCKKGSCIGGQCSFADTCCTLNDDCDDFNPCTIDACDKGKCVYSGATVPGCCAPVLLNAKFDSDEGWAKTSSVPSLGWGWADVGAAAKSAPGVWKMGSPTGATLSVLNNPLWVVSTATPVLSVLSGKETSVTFWSTIPTGTSTSVTLRVFAKIDGTDVNFLSLAGFQLTGGWKQFTIDLTPLGGKSFALEFELTASSTFGSLTGAGIYLDDVAISSTCKAKACANSTACNGSPWPYACLTGVCSDGQCTYANSCCTANADCNDNNLCTSDACGTNKKCTFAAIKGCCMGPGDCNDGNSCTQDVCPQPGAQCVNPAIASCCLSSAACDDKNTCTTDKCVQNKCINENLCCTNDAGCSDGETKCTTVKCVNSKCVHTPTNAAGCCAPEVWVNDFDQGDLKDIQITNSLGTGKGWQINPSPPGSLSKSAPGVLWYGDPAKGTFDMGATNGKALTPKILLPSATPSKVTMSILMDTESGGKGSYDDLVVSLLVGGQKVGIWDKGSGISTNKWYEVDFDLSKYMGQEIQIEFSFNTLDSVGNGGKGVFVDDLKVLTNCGG